MLLIMIKINHVALKLNKANAMLSKLRYVLDTITLSQSVVQYLSLFYAMLHFFGHKTQFI